MLGVYVCCIKFWNADSNFQMFVASLLVNKNIKCEYPLS